MRFRPVLMTGFSTVIGIIPLILGSGAGFESRLTIGIVLISGIIFSIFLTLLLTPFFYLLIEKSRINFQLLIFSKLFSLKNFSSISNSVRLNE